MLAEQEGNRIKSAMPASWPVRRADLVRQTGGAWRSQVSSQAYFGVGYIHHAR